MELTVGKLYKVKGTFHCQTRTGDELCSGIILLLTQKEIISSKIIKTKFLYLSEEISIIFQAPELKGLSEHISYFLEQL